MIKRLTDAILFAAECHDGQFRKDGHTPYINHPLEVMHLLAHTGEVTDIDVLVAAVLHDVVEDTQVTGAEIAQRFGEQAAKIVLELTDDKSLSKEERKKQQLITADQLSPGARLVRISDKICNVYDILYAPPGDWGMSRRRDYLVWSKGVIDKIRGENEKLEAKFDELIEEGFRFLEE